MSILNTDNTTSIYKRNHPEEKSIQRKTPPPIKEHRSIFAKRPIEKKINDTSVDIPIETKDFAKIKHAAFHASDINNKDKIESLKNKIQNGDYKIDYDILADKILKSEFV